MKSNAFHMKTKDHLQGIVTPRLPNLPTPAEIVLKRRLTLPVGSGQISWST